MKRERSKVHSAKQELQALNHKSFILGVVYAGCFSWFCLATYAAVDRHASTFVLFVGVISMIIFITAAHYWCKWSIAVVLWLILATVGSWYITNMAYGTQEAVRPSVVVEENSATVEGTTSNEEEDGSYYYTEIEKYTDELGVDLDRLLKDYGYEFLSYTTSEFNGALTQKELEKVDSYWITFMNRAHKSIIVFHSGGEWLGCYSPEADYMLRPALGTNGKPDINVCLNEAELYVNRSVLTHLMKFIDAQKNMPAVAETERGMM